jgi:hypothetical protein
MGPLRSGKRGVVGLHQPQAFLEKRRFADCAHIVNERGCRALPATRALPSVLLGTRFPTHPQTAHAPVDLVVRLPGLLPRRPGRILAPPRGPSGRIHLKQQVTKDTSEGTAPASVIAPPNSAGDLR